jgi:hypothetical protein
MSALGGVFRKRLCVLSAELYTFKNTLSKAALILKKIKFLDFSL